MLIKALPPKISIQTQRGKLFIYSQFLEDWMISQSSRPSIPNYP